jgi:hypothetical protein
MVVMVMMMVMVRVVGMVVLVMTHGGDDVDGYAREGDIRPLAPGE